MNTTKRKPLSPKQQEIYDYIVEYKKEFIVSPSWLDIAKALNTQIPNIQQVIKALEKKEYITREHRVPRSIKLV